MDSLQTVLRSLKTLQEMGLVKELTGGHNNKIFAYKDYLNIINKGTGQCNGLILNHSN